MSCSSFLPRRSRCEAIVFSLFAVLAAIAVTQAFIALTWAGGSSGFFGFGHSPMENVPHPHSTKGAVASMSTRCSDVGADMLEKGGNAADAMVALQFCLGVITSWVTGLGGGGFGLVRASNGSYEFIDFRETAPAAAFEEMYKDNLDASLYGGLASGVPGELRGLEYIHKQYGSLPWFDILQPAIHVARYGFTVSKDLAARMDLIPSPSFLVTDPIWSVDFAPNGTRVGAGDFMTRKRYADLLEEIANHGPDVFYNGPIAESTVAALRAANGTMTVQDLADYKVAIRPVKQISYRGQQVYACSVPAGGVVVLNVLKAVEGYSDLGWPAQLDLSTHRLTEAIRFGYGLRTKLGDPAFVEGMDEYQNSMLSDDKAAEVRSKISDLHTLPVAAYNPDGLESLETHGTSHAVAADASGLAISLTGTLNLLFGSQLMVPETSIIMNNEMNDFSIPNTINAFGYIASPANYIRPGKRPLSSMTPVIVELNNMLYFVVGGAGGSRIITAVIQALWNTLDRNMTSLEAVSAPRLHDQLVPNQVDFEYTYNNRTATFMRERGHNITWVPLGESSVHAIRRRIDKTFEAAGDPRLADALGRVVQVH